MADLVDTAAAATRAAAAAGDPDLILACNAADAYVRRYLDEPDTGWTADQKLGGLLLAVGLYRDKATPGVIEQYGTIERAAYRRATDIQIEQLLRIGRYAKPVIG